MKEVRDLLSEVIAESAEILLSLFSSFFVERSGVLLPALRSLQSELGHRTLRCNIL